MSGILNNQRLTGLVAEGGLILLSCGAPLALGGVHRSSVVIASLLSCLTLLAVWLHRRPDRRGLRVPLFGGALVGLTLFTAAQLVPLPLGFLGIIAPATRELLEVSVAGAGLPLGWHPVSLDPGATLLEALKVGTCALAFLVAHNLFYRSRRRDRLLLALVCTGVITTLLGFLGAAAAPGRPLMLYEPQVGGGAGLIVTSFVNPNHGAAFLMLCSLTAISLAMSTRDLQRRVLLGLAGVLTGSGVFLSLSRGGILVLALGLGLFAALLLWSQGGGRGVKQAALVSGGLALILGLSGWLAFDAILGEFLNHVPRGSGDLGKIGLWSSGLAMVLANPWVGVGRGAFSTAFTRYIEGGVPTNVTYSHLENQYLHLPAELGLAVGVGAILLSALCLVLWIKRGKHDAQSMALAAGLMALAVHNLVDFNLEVLGLALPAAVVAGLLSAGYREPGQSRRRSSSSRSRRSTDQRHAGSVEDDGEGARCRTTSRTKAGRGKVHVKTALITAAGLFALTLGAVMAHTPGADQSLNTVVGEINEGAPLSRIRRAVQGAVARHPADYLPHMAMSRAALAAKRPEAMAWLNRALFLFPHNPRLHVDTARALSAFGRRTQAILEYRLALQDGAPSAAVLRSGLDLAKDADEVGQLLLPRPGLHAEAVQILLEAKRLPLAREIVTAARERWSSNVRLALTEIDVQLATDQGDEARKAARRLARLIPRPETYLTWSRTAGKARAVKILTRAHKKFSQSREVALALVRALVRDKQHPRACAVAEEILRASRSSSDLAQAHDLMSEVYRADGRTHRAQYEAQQARKIRQGL